MDANRLQGQRMAQPPPGAGSCDTVQAGASRGGGLPGFHHEHLILVAYLRDWVYIAICKKKTKTTNPESCKELCESSSLSRSLQTLRSAPCVFFSGSHCTARGTQSQHNALPREVTTSSVKLWALPFLTAFAPLSLEWLFALPVTLHSLLLPTAQP